MAIGMTYEQYWYDDPLIVRAFYKADKLKQKRMDEQAWLTGMYVRSALDSTIGNAFRKTGQDPAEYPGKPLSVLNREEKEREKSEKEKEQEATWALAWMSSFVQAGKNWGKNKEQKG
jgi:hypothetical protein